MGEDRVHVRWNARAVSCTWGLVRVNSRVLRPDRHEASVGGCTGRLVLAGILAGILNQYQSAVVYHVVAVAVGLVAAVVR